MPLPDDDRIIAAPQRKTPETIERFRGLLRFEQDPLKRQRLIIRYAARLGAYISLLAQTHASIEAVRLSKTVDDGGAFLKAEGELANQVRVYLGYLNELENWNDEKERQTT